MYKAEDVIGTLMKEYLSLAQKQDEDSDTPQIKQSEENQHEENPAEPLLGTEDTSIVDHENDSSASKSSDETKLEKNCVSESSISPLQQFKNVVAIVDPPRVGLHPTVSDFEVFMCTSYSPLLCHSSCCRLSPIHIHSWSKNLVRHI